MPIERRPSSIDGIKRTAKELSKKKGIAHAKALDEAAVLAGYQNFAHARKIFSASNQPPNAHSRQHEFHGEARAAWIAACKAINPTNAASLSWTGTSAIISVLSHFMGENNNHVHLPTGGGLDFASAAPSSEAQCIDFGIEEQVAEIARPKRLTFERITEDEAESFLLLELDELAPSGAYQTADDDGTIAPDTARWRQREEVVELSRDRYVQRGVWDEGHLGYDEQGYEIPIPRSARLIVRWMRGKMLFVCKRSLWNLDSSTYDGRHNSMTAQQIRHVIEISMSNSDREGHYLYDTTDQAQGALANGTRVLHVKRDRPGVVTGSQWSHDRLVYNVSWEDKRAFPIFVEGEKLRAAP